MKNSDCAGVVFGSGSREGVRRAEAGAGDSATGDVASKVGELVDVGQKPVLLSQLSFQAVKLEVADVVPLPSVGLVVAEVVRLPSIGMPLRIELTAALPGPFTPVKGRVHSPVWH